jgi:hypothetical protein
MPFTFCRSPTSKGSISWGFSLLTQPRPVNGCPACTWRAGADLGVQKVNQLAGPVAVREALDRVEGEYDHLMCGCAPSLGPVTYNALAAGPILVPVEVTRLQVVGTLQRGVVPTGSVLGYLPTRHVEGQTESREALAALIALEGGRILRAHPLRDGDRPGPSRGGVAVQPSLPLLQGTRRLPRRRRRRRYPSGRVATWWSTSIALSVTSSRPRSARARP